MGVTASAVITAIGRALPPDAHFFFLFDFGPSRCCAGVYGYVRFSPDGRWLVTTGGAPRIWEVGTWREGSQLGGSDANIGEVRFSADSRLLAMGGGFGIVRLLRTETGEEIARLTAPPAAGCHDLAGELATKPDMEPHLLA